MLLAMRAAIRLSGIAWPGGSIYFSVKRMRRSPFMEVRLASPEVAAGKPDVARFADLGGHDIDIDRKQAALLDRADDGIHHRGTVAIGRRHHGFLHHVGAFLVDLLELEGVQRRLVVIASPRCDARRLCPRSEACRHMPRAFRHERRKDVNSLPDARPCERSRRRDGQYCRSRAPRSRERRWCDNCRCPRSGPSHRQTWCAFAHCPPSAARSIRPTSGSGPP